MDRYVAFLRGMNLGGRRIKNEELRRHFEGMGFDEVATFRASGNVIFANPGHEAEGELARRVEGELDKRLGYEVPVFLRSIEEVAAIAAREPFGAGDLQRSSGKLQVSLLMEKPSPAQKKKVLALATGEDLLAVEGREVYWLPSGGLLESNLDLKAIEKEAMKVKLRYPSPAMVVAVIALSIALGGSALGLGGGERSRTGHHPNFVVRTGNIVDRDTTGHDGVFNEAFGHARCKRGERLISGGLRLKSGGGGVLPGQNVSMVESGPVPKQREWTVLMNSDLGGAARQDFVVLTYCKR